MEIKTSKWGNVNSTPAYPSFAHDLFFRVGGVDSIKASLQPQAGTMMEINTGNVICDNVGDSKILVKATSSATLNPAQAATLLADIGVTTGCDQLLPYVALEVSDGHGSLSLTAIS
jgi:hypothetical protein